jgi:tRNA threonylcarbamoyl adenosine modification protein (Sua5/YciO/YrdC/YwlC family)
MTTGPVPLAVDADSLALAADALRNGAVVAVPTDTVYGLAADPHQPRAIERLFALKERPTSVALPVLVAGRDQLSAVCGPLGRAAEHLAGRFWPGPLTLVVPRRRSFTADLGGPPSARQTVGVRWPDHPVIESLCRRLGPLAVTSANRHGSAPATGAGQVAEIFSGEEGLALILDGGVCQGIPSTVVECRGPAIRSLREGAIPWADLLEGSRDDPRPVGSVSQGPGAAAPVSVPSGNADRGVTGNSLPPSATIA